MYIEKNNELIGAYIKKLVAKKYKNQRQFCIAYLKMANNEEPDDDEIRRMSNRFSQLIKGKKSIQIYDLPYFTELLGVSCDELLSGGKHFAPAKTHLTNYQVALSKDKKVWEKYMNHEDNLFLNYDEYGKTLIDYSFEFKNYKLLKYLMNEEIIWFIDGKKENYCVSFGAGTDIKRRSVGEIDAANIFPLERQKELRVRLITMALENDDVNILEELRARETNELYVINHFLSPMTLDRAQAILGKIDKEYIDEYTNSIANADDKTLDYYFEEFVIPQNYGRSAIEYECVVVFTYLGKVLESMILNKKENVDKYLKIALEHNKRILDEIENFDKVIRMECKNNPELEYVHDHYCYEKHFSYNEELNFVSLLAYSTMRRITSNLIVVNCKSKDSKIMKLINEINKCKEEIIAIGENKEL